MKEPSSIDVKDLINESPIGPFHFIVLFFCFLIVAVDGYDTGAIGYVAPSLVAEWGVAKPALAPLLSAALFGLAAGALTAGPMADRFGRKKVVILSVALFGIFSLGTAFAGTLDQMTVWRFLTGIGLGAAMPNAITLMAEYCPERRRAVIVNTMFCGFPLGASLGGVLAAWLVPSFGWRSVLLVGGAGPLLLAALLIALLPESVMHLAVRGNEVDRIKKILSRITLRNLDAVQTFVVTEKGHHDGGQALRLVLSRQYAIGSVMLWVTYFMGLVMFYLLTSWMPLIMKGTGFSIEKAALLSALFPLGGGIGAIFAGWLMDRVVPHFVIAGAYALTGVLLCCVANVLHEPVLLALMIFLAGTAMNGAQVSMPTLGAAFYPTAARATGVSWMLGVGRFGAISGALIGGEFMRWQLGFSSIFMLIAIPAFVATAALVVKYVWSRAKVGLAEVGVVASQGQQEELA